MGRTTTISREDLDLLDALLTRVDDAHRALGDLTEKCRVKGDLERVEKLRTAGNRLDEAHRITEGAFK